MTFRSSASSREAPLIDIIKVMANHRLDAIVHKSVEHTPSLVKDGIGKAYSEPPIKLADAYEHAAKQRIPPKSTPLLPTATRTMDGEK